jgi:UDP-N-acetylmuramoyl-tripeptide--D-alanyl-D-alanine ligase
MHPLTLSELASALAGRVQGKDVAVSGVAIDSRQLAPGDLFVALPGSRVDGHDFIAQAREAGAAAALVSRVCADSLPQLQVADVLTALGQLGALNRAAFDGQLIAITGSSGKTSVKGMLSTVLAAQAPVLATSGNLNNEIGVPLTLLALSPQHGLAVIEMGARGKGHIDYLCRLARPDISVLLNAGAAHLEGFGSLQGVADAKAEIYDHLDAGGTAVVNADQEFTPAWLARAGATGARIITFGDAPAADVRAEDVALAADHSRFLLCHAGERQSVHLPLAGAHSVRNALATTAVALACGMALDAIAAGLGEVRSVAGRLQRSAAPDGATLIDDAYNANPASVRAAIDVLAADAAPRVLVLGAMLELGELAQAEHAAVGRYARERGIDTLVAVGELPRAAADAFGPGARWYATREEAIADLAAWRAGARTILVKGSRGSAMESVLTALSEGRATAC